MRHSCGLPSAENCKAEFFRSDASEKCDLSAFDWRGVLSIRSVSLWQWGSNWVSFLARHVASQKVHVASLKVCVGSLKVCAASLKVCWVWFETDVSMSFNLGQYPLRDLVSLGQSLCAVHCTVGEKVHSRMISPFKKWICVRKKEVQIVRGR